VSQNNISDSLETVLEAFIRAWISGERPDVEEYIERYPEYRERLRKEIDDFLFVAARLPMGVGRKGEGTPEALEINSGQLLGDFRILKEIGRGGMGVVYEAEQVSLKRKVALKVLPPFLSHSARSVNKFHREAEAAGRQRHPGIVAVYAVGECEGIHYIAQELVEDGESLSDRLDHLRKEGDFPIGYFREAAEITAAAADALQHAHDSGVIHRDVKPSNILLTPENLPKVTDFGLAKVEDALRLSRTGDFAGTPYYMPPEQVARRQTPVERRSDIYSLGVTLYEMITLELPFEGETSQEVMKKILLHEPRNPKKVNPRVPADLAVVCLKAMEKKPEDRYQTMAELSEDLRRYGSGDVIQAKPAGRVKRLWKWIRRRPLVASLISVAIIAALALGEAGRQSLLARSQQEQIARLTASAQLSKLENQAEELWPVIPDSAEALESWLERADDLLGNHEMLTAALHEMRKKALPYTPEARIEARKKHPQYVQLNKFEKARSTLEKEVEIARKECRGEITDDFEWDRPFSEDPQEKLNTINEELGRVNASIRRIDGEIAAWRTWRFEDPDDQWRYDILLQAVSDFDAFTDETSGIRPSVKRRLDHARNVEAVSLKENEQEWRQAIASIADKTECPQYDGLRIEPQLGLVPLGRDPESGLWEFAHMQTGEIKARNPDGSLPFTEDSGVVFILIPGGRYRMGAQQATEEMPEGNPNIDPHARNNEYPIHWVQIPPFFISKFEMTQAQWLRIIGENPSKSTPFCRFGDKQHSLLHPVEMVSWADCTRWLSRLGLRLPSEAEWEYAARAGTTTIWWTGNEPDSLVGAINLMDRFYVLHGPIKGFVRYQKLNDGYARHAPVNAFRPNPFGLYNACGNVAEWCADYYRVNYIGAPQGSEPWERAGMDAHPARGGSWFEQHTECRSAYRTYANPTFPLPHVGCRAAKSITVSGQNHHYSSKE